MEAIKFDFSQANTEIELLRVILLKLSINRVIRYDKFITEQIQISANLLRKISNRIEEIKNDKIEKITNQEFGNLVTLIVEDTKNIILWFVDNKFHFYSKSEIMENLRMVILKLEFLTTRYENLRTEYLKRVFDNLDGLINTHDFKNLFYPVIDFIREKEKVIVDTLDDTIYKTSHKKFDSENKYFINSDIRICKRFINIILDFETININNIVEILRSVNSFANVFNLLGKKIQTLNISNMNDVMVNYGLLFNDGENAIISIFSKLNFENI